MDDLKPALALLPMFAIGLALMIIGHPLTSALFVVGITLCLGAATLNFLLLSTSISVNGRYLILLLSVVEYAIPIFLEVKWHHPIF